MPIMQFRDPMASYMQQSGKTEKDYNDIVNSGYRWMGSDWELDPSFGGSPGSLVSPAAGRGAQGPLSGSGNYVDANGIPRPGGAGSTTSITGSSSGSANPFDVSAQAAQIRDDMRRIRERSQGALNEDVSARGIFSSGVSADLMKDLNLGLGTQEAAALERLRNDAASREAAWKMELQRFEMQQRALGAGAAKRYGKANEIQVMREAYRTGGGGETGGGGADGGGGLSPDPRTLGALELARAYYRETGEYGSPQEQAAWASDIWGFRRA